MQDKKSRERTLLKELRPKVPGFPQGEITDSEGPDFLVRGEDGETVGIELVDYVRGQSENGSPLRQDESLRARILTEAKSRFESEDEALSLEVHFSWFPRVHLKKDFITSLASQITTLVRTNIPPNVHDMVCIDAREFPKPLNRYLRRIILVRLHETTSSHWSSVGAGWIAVSLEEIQSLINAKGQKLADYRKNCDKVWLVIVADGKSISSQVDLPADIHKFPIETDFDEIIFWDRCEAKVVPLNLQRRA